MSAEPGLEAIYERYADLFDAEAFQATAPPGDGGADGEGIDLRAYLREFLAIGIEGHRTRALQDRYLEAESRAVARVDGETIPYRELPVRVRRAEGREHRAALEDARLGVVERTLNPILEDSIGIVHGVAEELLGTSYDRYCERLAGIDFEALQSEADRLLEKTRDVHEDLLDWFVRRHLPGVRREDLETHDLARLLYGEPYRDRFPGGELVDRLTGPVRAMGIDPTAEGRIEFDLEDRAAKTPRAFCASVRVPDEVKLVLRPYGGYDDYVTFLHELGHALHFGYVQADLPMEYRRLGDNGVTEGYAMTFDHLMHLAPFLRKVVGMGEVEEFLRFQAFRDLVMVRRYCAKLGYERSLHRKGPGPGRSDEYVERLSEATGARAPDRLWLEDVDPHFYCVRYLRAWMLAGAMHRELRERFDDDWFVNPAAGPFLLDLFGLGQALPADALARERLAVERLDFGPLLEMIRERI
ncbi:MAG: hypothetical protein KY397_01595 [Gemmatimonadetes bacterium]|nr:hypothetical protein [Gemmatimonadota bacterium]